MFSVLFPVAAALFFLVVPPDVLGATESWERGTVRLIGLFLSGHALVAFSTWRTTGRTAGDSTIGALAGVVTLSALVYLVTGNGLFLVLAFSLVVGMSLNLSMKRLDLVFERAQERIGWRVPLPEQHRRR